jgi:hypothetical protein
MFFKTRDAVFLFLFFALFFFLALSQLADQAERKCRSSNSYIVMVFMYIVHTRPGPRGSQESICSLTRTREWSNIKKGKKGAENHQE